MEENTQKKGSVIDLTSIGTNPTVLVRAFERSLIESGVSKTEIIDILTETYRSGTVEGILKTIYKYIETIITEDGILSQKTEEYSGRRFDIED